jgi:hypothetical protein
MIAFDRAIVPVMWVTAVAVTACFTTGGLMLKNGYDATLQPTLPSRCSFDLTAVVARISRTASLLPTGNSVVHFKYNTTHYDHVKTKHCAVEIHNSWRDVHTEDHFPIGSSHDIYDCGYGTCATTGSLSYIATVGFWLVMTGTFLLLLIFLRCAFVCPDDPFSYPLPPPYFPPPPLHPPPQRPEPIVQNNEKMQEENEAVAVAVSESNHAHPYALASVV